MKPPETLRETTARHSGVCRHCEQQVEKGQRIWWGPGYVYHAHHFDQSRDEKAPQEPHHTLNRPHVSVEPRELKARYPGVCKECGRDIKEGQKIWWAPGYVYHREHFPFAQGEGPEYYEGWEDYEGPSNYVEYEDARTEANRLVSGFNADGSRGDADLGIEGRG